MTTATEHRTFELQDASDATRLLRGRVESPAGTEERGEVLPAVLILHGFKGFMNWGFFPELSRRIAARGFVAVSFNMSGCGVGEDLESFTEHAAFERNTPTRELEDVEMVREFLRSGALPWVDSSRMGIFGHSLGGGIALLHAEQGGDWRAVVTWAAISHLNRYDEATAAQWRRDGHLEIKNSRTGQVHRLGAAWLDDVTENPARLDILAACGRSRTPSLIIHGTQDESVPLEEAEAIAEAFGSGLARLITLDGANHTFGAGHPLGEVSSDLERAVEETLGHLERFVP